jgi:hypothetical protein
MVDGDNMSRVADWIVVDGGLGQSGGKADTVLVGLLGDVLGIVGQFLGLEDRDFVVAVNHVHADRNGRFALDGVWVADLGDVGLEALEEDLGFIVVGVAADISPSATLWRYLVGRPALATSPRDTKLFCT